MKTNFMSLDGETKVVNETVFASYVGNNLEKVKTTLKPINYRNVLHIGYDKFYGDVFKCWDDDINYFTIFFGTAGDEFKK